MYLIVCIQNSHLTNKDFVHLLASCNIVSLCSFSGAQPALHFGGGNFHEFHSMTLLCLFNHGTTLSQTITAL